jgi:allophanate hydrolase subunit 1
MAPSLSALPLDCTMVLFSPTFTVVNVGDSAVRAIVSGANKILVRKRVRALAQELGSSGIPGLVRLVPTNDALLVEFDPAVTEASALKRRIRIIDASISGPQE